MPRQASGVPEAPARRERTPDVRRVRLPQALASKEEARQTMYNMPQQLHKSAELPQLPQLGGLYLPSKAKKKLKPLGVHRNVGAMNPTLHMTQALGRSEVGVCRRALLEKGLRAWRAAFLAR